MSIMLGGLGYPGSGAGAGTTIIAQANVAGSGAADYTTTSATYVSVDATNLTITTINAVVGDILEIIAVCEGGNSGANIVALTFNIAGTDVGDTLGLMIWNEASNVRIATLLYYYTVVSNTTILLRWKTAAGTASMLNRSAVVRPRMSVKNLNRGGVL